MNEMIKTLWIYDISMVHGIFLLMMILKHDDELAISNYIDIFSINLQK